MDFKPLNIRLTPGPDDPLAEYLAKFEGKAGGRAGGAKRPLYRALGLPEPPAQITADETLLRRLIREEIRAAQEVRQDG
ncbi:MAG TPA: hypothetical protein VGK74_02970 [Symbiobacteriaceae bacterium]|jgi:hypothetical protein